VCVANKNPGKKGEQAAANHNRNKVAGNTVSQLLYRGLHRNKKYLEKSNPNKTECRNKRKFFSWPEIFPCTGIKNIYKILNKIKQSK
jgi:hypothetical protein